MSGRKTIGMNPLSAHAPGEAAPGPNPLDVLIPRSGADSAPAIDVATSSVPVIAQADVEAASAPIVAPALPHLADSVPIDAAVPVDVMASTPPDASSDPSGGPVPGQYLVFEAGGESLAISILHVREIVEYGLVTRVPLMPKSIRGVTNLRGSIVPVVDLAVRLGLSPQPRNPHTCVVVVDACLGGHPSVVGLVADAVSTVRELTHDEVSPTPALGSKVSVDAFAGLGRAGDRLFPVLDAKRMLSGLQLTPQAGVCR